MDIKVLILIILLCGCTNSIKKNESLTQTNDELILFDWLFYNSHRIEHDDLDYGNIIENLKNKIPLKDYYMYRVLVNAHEFDKKESDIELLIKADELGNPEAGGYIHSFYFINDFNKKIKYLKSSANKGDSISQFRLGVLYFYGRKDFKIDRVKGLKYYRLAAWGGSSQAILSLGDAVFESYLGSEEFQFWRVINGLYEHEEEFEDKLINIEVELSKIKDKLQFCNNYKKFILKNIIPHKDFHTHIYPNLLKVLGGCMQKI